MLSPVKKYASLGTNKPASWVIIAHVPLDKFVPNVSGGFLMADPSSRQVKITK